MLTPINTVLYATDLGTGMDPALRMAMSLAAKYQAQVTLLHVIEPINQAVYTWQSEDFWQDIRQNTQKVSTELAEERLSYLFEKENLGESVKRPEVVIKHGRVPSTVLQTGDDIDADLIVMGTHSHTALGELILGSNADKVVRMSRRPVLLVPTTEKVASV